MKFNSNDRIFISIFLGLAIIYTFPLLTHQSFFVDDLGRSLYGGLGWSGNGRPLSDFIFYIINFGIPIIDASPLPLMLGIVILALALSCVREKLFGDDYITASLCFMMILANPFFIENLSYRYDSLTMCMSVAISIISSYVAYQYKPINIIISSILTIAFLSLYQAALNTYAIFLLAFIISDVVKKYSLSNIIKNALSSVAALMVGYFIYSFFIAKKLVTGTYNIEHSKIIEINSSLIEVLTSNVLSFYRMFSTILNGGNYLIYYSLFFAIIVSLIVIILKIIKRDENKKAKILLVSLSLLASIFFIIGPMILLKSPIYAPRVLIGMGGFMFFCCLCVFYAFENKRSISRIYFSFILVVSTIFSYGAYNAISAQFKFEENIVNRISQDIEYLGLGSDKEKIKFIGVEPYTSINENIVTKHPLMKELIPRIINNDWMWSEVLIQRNPFSRKFTLQTENINLTDDWVKGRNSVYSIGVVRDTIVIKFNE
ncbi:glucosyltransferase domain-containing protein [Salmonella enterica]|nr:glucosyltransferase domain-containing protein [Salmonella enterica]EJW2025192.1 glucosyltransferase domain-containing protein [Salmonella enterica]EJW2101138.1 glucosyltransferase domain-containing protein [Salmonella enterica]